VILKDENEVSGGNHSDESGKDRLRRRAEVSCRLFFFGDDDFEGEGVVRDVSTTGCRASTTVDVHTGMILKLSLFLPDYKWPLRVDQAVVQWVKGQEFGVEFRSIRLAQQERIRALVMKAKR
jgi:hypothetical protein